MMMRVVRFDFVAVRFDNRHDGGDEECDENERCIRRSIALSGMMSLHLFISNRSLSGCPSLTFVGIAMP